MPRYSTRVARPRRLIDVAIVLYSEIALAPLFTSFTGLPMRFGTILSGANPLITGVAIVCAALAIGLVAHLVVVLINRRAAKRSAGLLNQSLEEHCR
jgi:hypothetical protein